LNSIVNYLKAIEIVPWLYLVMELAQFLGV
jgi:hypothetical protein